MHDLYLEHHGIKGMKWGIRRYQNKDGSLTNAGRKRAAKLAAQKAKINDEYKSLTGKKIPTNPSGRNGKSGKPKSDSPESTAPKKKSVKEMSDAELQQAVNRLNLEQRYNQLNPKQVSKGQAFANKVFKDVLIPVATDVAKQALTNQLKKAMNLPTGDGKKKKK